MKRSVTLTDILDGHAVLDISCLDRIYLNGYVPRLQTSGQVVGFLHHRGFPIPSPAALGRNGDAFRQAMQRYAQANGIPWIRFGKDDRKIDVIRPLLEAAERDGRPGIVAIGVAQEFQWVCAATCRGTSNGIPWFSYYRTERRVTCFMPISSMSGQVPGSSRSARTRLIRSKRGSTAMRLSGGWLRPWAFR